MPLHGESDKYAVLSCYDIIANVLVSPYMKHSKHVLSQSRHYYHATFTVWEHMHVVKVTHFNIPTR